MSISITNARKKLYDLANNVIENNESVTINTKKGEVLLVSKENYNSLLETLFLSSDAEYKKSLIEGMKEPIENCLDEENLNWWIIKLNLQNKQQPILNT